MGYPKPILFISKCLGLESCRYDGGVINSSVISRMRDHVRIKTICPEVGIGLGIPRALIRIGESDGKLELYQSSTSIPDRRYIGFLF